MVYLYAGALHLVGMGLGEKEGRLQVPEGISCVRGNPKATIASDLIQTAVKKLIQGYPEKAIQSIHHAHAKVPIGVAALLQENPSLIAPAVTAFCQKDPTDLKACRAMRYFPPENCVMRRIALTRFQYALLMHQQFTPDRRTGWVLPPPLHPDRSKHMLGIKLACGFEILVAHAKSLPSPCSSDPEVLDGETKDGGIIADPTWKLYLANLEKNGYFEGLLEGSKEHSRKLKEAYQFFMAAISEKNGSNLNGRGCRPSSGSEILSLLKSLDIEEDVLRREESKLEPPDDDAWLEISSEELDAMLDERYGVQKKLTVGMDTDPSSISARMNEFLEHVSGIEGAEFPRCNDDVAGEASTTAPSSNKVDFDADAFSCAVKGIVDLIIPEDNWDLESSNSESGMSSYEDEGVGTSRRKKNGVQKSKIQEYMEQMDKELAETTLAESFIKAPPRKKKLAKAVRRIVIDNLLELFCCKEMPIEVQLDQKEAVKDEVNGKSLNEGEDGFDDVEDFCPVDVDVTALHGVLESMRIQGGGPGPASNLLGPMGVRPDVASAGQEQQ
ncbi:hypothetical protein J437_LFUL004325 [Ladona fulva]|uniref:Uncharacterized protein n=1 Tax=Ladona fulva TaxID=123851 RepID=A0A8K0NXL2_LADFU|nr:hypothetical protein J437_LFUL004325 [Ladona fulva]